MDNNKYLEYILRMQSIAKIGLKFSSDPYALENYQQVQELSKEMLNDLMGEEIIKDNHYQRDVYPTPNVSVRVLIEQDNKYLFVRERFEQKYVIPGGWCEVFQPLSKNAIDEVAQETGFQIKTGRILAIFNRGVDKSSTSEYLVVISAKIVSGEKKINHECDDIDFFSYDNLPPLSHKMSSDELNKIIEIYENELEPYFD